MQFQRNALFFTLVLIIIASCQPVSRQNNSQGVNLRYAPARPSPSRSMPPRAIVAQQKYQETIILSEAGRQAAFDEAMQMRKTFTQYIRPTAPSKITPEYRAWVIQKSLEFFAVIEDMEGKMGTQYFLLVDQSRQKQIIYLGLYDNLKKSIIGVGWDIVSTGDEDWDPRYVTKPGIYVQNLRTQGVRSDGLPNEEDWIRFGPEGSRIFNFERDFEQTNGRWFYVPTDPRVSLHSTDPRYGEQRLGSRQSKGCIRVPLKFNLFLDQFCIIDQIYLQNPRQTSWLLRPDRTPVKFPGKFLFIITS